MRRWLVMILALVLSLQTHVLAAPQGAAWSDHSPRPNGIFFDVTFALDRFLVADESDHSVWSSPDGVAWEQGHQFSDKPVRSLQFVNGQFIVVADVALMASSDGRTWHEIGTLPAAVRETANGPRIRVAYGNGRYVAHNDTAHSAWSSADGKAWQISQGELPGPAADLIYAGGRFLATIARQGADWRDQYTELYTSADGLVWDAVPGSAHKYSADAACNGKLAGTAGRDDQLGVSADGVTWEATGISGYGVACAGDRFVAATTGHLLVSANGGTWAEVPMLPDWTPTYIAYGKGRYVLADSRTLFTSEPLCAGAFDLPAGDHACAAVSRLVERGIMQGFPDGLLRPGERLTRAQAAKLLVVTLGKGPEPAGPVAFRDAKQHWAAMQGYVQAAVAAKAIAGYPDGSFRPDEPVTRAQLVKMIAAAAGLSAGGTQPYTDIRRDDWMAGWVSAAYQAGMIGAQARTPAWIGSTFSPEATVTRAEAAILLDNLRAYQAK